MRRPCATTTRRGSASGWRSTSTAHSASREARWHTTCWRNRGFIDFLMALFVLSLFLFFVLFFRFFSPGVLLLFFFFFSPLLRTEPRACRSYTRAPGSAIIMCSTRSSLPRPFGPNTSSSLKRTTVSFNRATPGQPPPLIPHPFVIRFLFVCFCMCLSLQRKNKKPKGWTRTWSRSAGPAPVWRSRLSTSLQPR